MATRTEHLNMRLTPELKARLEQAARLGGCTLTALFEAAMLRELKTRPARGRRQQISEARNTT